MVGELPPTACGLERRRSSLDARGEDHAAVVGTSADLAVGAVDEEGLALVFGYFSCDLECR